MTPAGFEVDHLFVSVSRGAPEADALIERGFAEGSPNVHPGQGTACRRIFFENVYLELAWLEDEVEASAPAVERTGLGARMGCVPEASRLGVALRPEGPARREIPISTWPYEPPYLPQGTWMPVATSSRILGEPLLFFLPWARTWESPVAPHPNGARAVTAVRITVAPGRSLSPALCWLRDSGCVRLGVGAAEGVVFELDGGRAGQSATLAPAAPLRLEW